MAMTRYCVQLPRGGDVILRCLAGRQVRRREEQGCVYLHVRKTAGVACVDMLWYSAYLRSKLMLFLGRTSPSRVVVRSEARKAPSESWRGVGEKSGSLQVVFQAAE
jgi:hypothetical protein